MQELGLEPLEELLGVGPFAEFLEQGTGILRRAGHATEAVSLLEMVLANRRQNVTRGARRIHQISRAHGPYHTITS